MLQLYDLEHKKLHGLTEYKDARLERELKSGDEKLSFSYPLNDKFYKDIVEESYVRTKENEYIIKEIHELDDWTEFTCVLNVEDMEGKVWDRFESVENSIVDALNLAIVNTGWTVGHNNVSKKRTVRKTNCSSWDIVQDIKKTYMVDMQFDCINKKINIYEHLGNDKGVYFMDSLNIKKLETQRDSYDFFTRLIPLGKDGLSIKDINSGKDYVENYQYSKKIKTLIWKDERYTVSENLKTDAEAKLNDLSKPRRAYRVDVINLSKISKDKYKILDYNLGDTITLISKDKNVREKQRIVKTTEYLQDHSKDSVEIANTILSFEEMQQDLQQAAETINNVTTDNGTVNGKCVEGIETNQISDFKEGVNKFVDLSTVNADITNLRVKKVDAQDLNAVKGRIGTLEATTITTTQFKALEGQINFFKSTFATIHDAEITNAKVKIIEGKVSNFDEALAGNLTSKNFKANSITAESGIIAEGAIGDAQISNVNINKLKAGDIDTSKINLVGPLRRLRIIGDKIQILDNKDGKLYERIMLGVDDNNNSTLILRGQDGKTILLNQNGLTNAGFTDGYNKINDNTLSATKFEKNSIVRQINNATETIKGTKVQIGDRTLDVELFTQNNTIKEHDKELVTQKSSINALDNAIKLKVDNQVFTKTTNTINTAIEHSNKDATNKAKDYTDNISKKLKEDSEKYANEVAVAKANLAQVNAQAHADNKITVEEKARIKEATDNLNTALAKSKEAEKISKSYTDKVAEEKKNEAIKNAKDYTNAEITTVNTNLHKATSKVDILQDKINTKVSQVDIDKSIKSLKIGNRNLVLNSNLIRFYPNNTGLGHSILVKDITGEFYRATPDPNKVVSLYYFCKDKNVSNQLITDSKTLYSMALDVRIGEKSSITRFSFHGSSKTISPILLEANVWTRIKLEGFSLASYSNKALVIALDNSTNIALDYKNFKLVEGNVISNDWTPAPEDNQNLIINSEKSITEKIDNVNSELNQTKNSLTANINDLHSKTKTIETNITNANNNISSLNKSLSNNITNLDKNLSKNINDISKSLSDNINSLDKDLSNKINKTKDEVLSNAKNYTNIQIKTVETNVHDNTTQLNILKNQISTKVSQVDIDKSINNIKTGNRNLIFDSLINETSSLYGFATRDTAFLEKGKEYTFKFNGHVDEQTLKDGKELRVYIWESTWKSCISLAIKSLTDITESIKFTPTLSCKHHVSAYLYTNGGSRLGKVTVNWYKLIEGNSTSDDWTPAPEDTQHLIIDNTKIVEEKIDNVSSELNQVKNGFTTTVNDLHSKTKAIETNITNTNTNINNLNKNLSKNIASVNKSLSDNINNLDKSLLNEISNNLNTAKRYTDSISKKLKEDSEKYANEVAVAKANLAQVNAQAHAEGKISEEEKARIKQATDNLNTALAKSKEAEKLSKSYTDKVAEEKKNEALNNSKDYTNTKINSVETNVRDNKTQLNILKDEVSSKIQNFESKTNSLELKTDKIKDLATAMAVGKMLYPDPTFKVGNNNIGTYNNLGNGKVTVQRIAKISDCPNASTHCLEIKTTGQASPWFGGFYFGTSTRANAIFVTRIIAKIPVGRKIEWASNAIGDNGKKEWLTSTNGTGQWEEYICKVTCGSKGSFSSTNFFALHEGSMPNDSSPLIWYVAYATVFDITENDESINNLKIETTETKNKIAEIKQTTDTLKGSIEQTQVKTKSIENTLKDKATKNDVKEVSNKVTTVQANLNSISEKITHTDSSISKINNDLVSCNNRISTAEHKLNDDSITNTVINSWQYRDNMNKFNIFKDEMTQFKQSSNSFIADIKSNNPRNFVKNSVFGTGDLQNWTLWGVPSWGVYSDASLGHEYSCKLQCTEKTTGICQKVNGLIKGNLYTVSAKLYVDEGYPGLMVDNDNSWNGVNFFYDQGYGKWVTVNFSFTAKTNEINLYIGRINNEGDKATFWVSEVQIREGKFVLPWVQSGNEICGATVKINTDEIKINFEDGAYSLMGRKGLEHWHNGMAKPYHYLFHRGSIDRVNSQQTVRIYVPEEFKGKDYGISWWSGNVFPQDNGDLIFSANTELVNQNKQEGWFDLKASLLVRNPSKENSPNWRGQMNLVYTIIA